jgi:hypothetical protein
MCDVGIVSWCGRRDRCDRLNVAWATHINGVYGVEVAEPRVLRSSCAGVFVERLYRLCWVLFHIIY